MYTCSSHSRSSCSHKNNGNKYKQVLGQIIKGFAQPLTPTHAALLHHVLLPLHRVNEMYEWRDQIPLIQVYIIY